MEPDERIELARKALREEHERRKQILKRILEKWSWELQDDDVEEWLDIIDEFNEEVEK